MGLGVQGCLMPGGSTWKPTVAALLRHILQLALMSPRAGVRAPTVGLVRLLSGGAERRQLELGQ